ncbi:hypothetical protein LUZ63_007028 [Rhynchospora breviuscula]|uniref:Uncharacterized protein n=1 Tax=Rhynchospora breviuscula TaxID=2022672 RepID=A0A9Q0HU28_9POAL|nr:hypothetical protein LUZ63_007028 [Rhynchospora breviuscula]
MRIAAQVISLLLLSQLVVSAQGIRLEKESLVALMKQIHPGRLENQEGKSTKETELLHTKSVKKCKGATKEGTMRKSTKGHDHMIPSFHEDYYGPRDHKPKHH